MATQDRNADRNAQFIRKHVTVPVVSAAAINNDDPFFSYQPRFNFRLTDLTAYATVIATTLSTIKAIVAPLLSAAGNAVAASAAAVTFSIELYFQNVAGVLTSRAATAAQAFTGTETIAANLWGVWLVQVTAAGVQTTKAAADAMAFATEADALAATPAPDALNGVCTVITIQAAGGVFTAGTTNTNAGNAFNSHGREGHSLVLAVSAARQQVQGTRATALRDDAGVRLIVGTSADLIVLTARRTAASVITNGQAVMEFRKTPAQGEGIEASTGLAVAQVP